jgi:ribosomal-protein-alanine N-acetyltransferase
MLPLLMTKRLMIKPLESNMAEGVKDFELRNEERLGIWDPPKWHEDWKNIRYWEEDGKAWEESAARGESAPFTLFSRDNPRHIIGFITLSKILYGPLLSAELGYKIDLNYEGRGLMQEGLEKVLEFAFIHLRLRRVNANYRPENIRSGLLLRRLGFGVEGYAKGLVYIDGAWRDHVLMSKFNPDESIRQSIPYTQNLENHPWE